MLKFTLRCQLRKHENIMLWLTGKRKSCDDMMTASENRKKKRKEKQRGNTGHQRYEGNIVNK